MKAFKITGSFYMGEKWQAFTKEIAAADKKGAKETLLSDLGSKHRVKRNRIKITKMDELKPDDVESSIIKYKMEAK